jgi:hypothetical protein
MMTFVIPVKSKTVSSNWTYFSSLVNRSINSICNQSKSNFKVLVVCHEIPKTNFENDSRVEFLKVKFAPPILKNNADDRWLKEADKGKKLKFGAEYSATLGAEYMMTVDSDDCISNKISEYVFKNSDDSIPGWYVKQGYLYPEGKKYAYLNLKNFNHVCGSGVIIKPELIDLMYGDNFWFKHERSQLENGLSLLPLPFTGAIYSILNGTNIRLDNKEIKKRTSFNPSKLKSIQTLIRRLLKYRIIPTLFIKNKFSLYDLSQKT